MPENPTLIDQDLVTNHLVKAESVHDVVVSVMVRIALVTLKGVYQAPADTYLEHLKTVFKARYPADPAYDKVIALLEKIKTFGKDAFTAVGYYQKTNDGQREYAIDNRFTLGNQLALVVALALDHQEGSKDAIESLWGALKENLKTPGRCAAGLRSHWFFTLSGLLKEKYNIQLIEDFPSYIAACVKDYLTARFQLNIPKENQFMIIRQWVISSYDPGQDGLPKLVKDWLRPEVTSLRAHIKSLPVFEYLSQNELSQALDYCKPAVLEDLNPLRVHPLVQVINEFYQMLAMNELYKDHPSFAGNGMLDLGDPELSAVAFASAVCCE